MRKSKPNQSPQKNSFALHTENLKIFKVRNQEGGKAVTDISRLLVAGKLALAAFKVLVNICLNISH